ncbi:hypothetical protein AB6A40_011443 [Gnathostoma spinigerum]|uniref:Uncharacterized protein n=1 Tax=Gnathostoma spinigerum TaxID=75299 RepID=A0ABD6EXN1_9BILA
MVFIFVTNYDVLIIVLGHNMTDIDRATSNCSELNENLASFQVIREMVYLERNTGKLADEVIQLRSENGRLKELLQKHNIEFTHALAKMAKRRKNGDECIAGDVDGVAVV